MQNATLTSDARHTQAAVGGIRFSVIYRGRKFEILTYENEYRSLQALIHDKLYTEDFGDCKGIGRCGTCLVMVDSPSLDLPPRQGNEETTLTRMGVDLSSCNRLACQLLLSSAINGASFTVLT